MNLNILTTATLEDVFRNASNDTKTDVKTRFRTRQLLRRLMIRKSGNSHHRVVAGIRQATELESRGETDLAVWHLSALMEEFPAAASLHGYAALFLSRAGRFNEAIEHGRQAILFSPGSEKASLILFEALWKSRQHVEALDEMKRFLALRPSEEYSKIIREWNLSEGG